MCSSDLMMAAIGFAAAAGAQTFPVKPIRIVTTEAGSGTDFGARMVAQCISGPLGQQVVVENRGGVMPNEVVAKAQPDGYTLVHNGSALWLLPFVQSDLGWNPQRDFIAVSMTDQSPNVLLVQPTLPVKNVQDLIALAKAKPGELNYASSGIGASAHLAAELLKSLAGIDIAHIAYRGQPPAILDMISGRVQLMFANVPVALPQINAGKLRALAVTTLPRSPQLPAIPTIAESGFAGFEVNQWTGLVAPQGTPKAIVVMLHDAVVAALDAPEVRANLISQGFQPAGGSPEQFAAYIQSELKKWSALIRERGIRAD